MPHFDSSEITIDQSRMTVLLANGEILAAPLMARVNTDTGEVTFHTDPNGLTPAIDAEARSREPSDSGTTDSSEHGAVVAPSPASVTERSHERESRNE